MKKVKIPPKNHERLASTSSAWPSLSEAPCVNEDFLDSPMLTSNVWSELFGIYEKHFASDFSFLHRRRFLEPFLPGPASAKQDSGCSPRPPHSAPLLLAFLTVTARYHNDLIFQLRSTSIVIAQRFADATRKSLGDVLDGRSSLELAQALLFLAFHDFTDFQGLKGWYKLVIATRMVQNLDYSYDESSKGADMGNSNDELVRSEAFIDSEIQRRTLWSCFIMDRLMSHGKERPHGIHLEYLEGIQLPCSHIAFIRGIKVQTRHLSWSDDEYANKRNQSMEAFSSPHRHANGAHQDVHRSNDTDGVEWEYGDSEGELGFYIRAIHHFGDIRKWSVMFRQNEEAAPWDPKSTFNMLERKTIRLTSELPRHLTLTSRNTTGHLIDKTSRTYVLIHATYTLCAITLYRDYVTFSPWSTKPPCGSRITEQPDDPMYWVKKAKDLFGAANQFADVLKACRSAGALIDTPVAGWTTYFVAWSALYCHFFPRMDPDRALDSRLEDSVWATANDILVDLEARFKMAGHWLSLLVKSHDYYKEERKSWKAHAYGSPASNSSASGGLRDYPDFFAGKEDDSLVDLS